MRFILNFIFFGILFYFIYMVFPDAFATLVSWANHAYEFLRDLWNQLVLRYEEWRQPAAPVTALLPFLNWK